MYLLIVFSYEKRVSVPQSHFNCALLIKTMEEPCNEWRRTADVTEREGEFNETEREGVGAREREKGKSVEKGRGKYREGGSLLTKDGVKMEGEKYGKGDPWCYSTLPLSLSFSHSFPFGRSGGNTPTETRWKISKFRRWHPQGHAATF